LFINLTPLIPLSTLGEGKGKKEGRQPLLDAPLSESPSRRKRFREGACPKTRELERGEASVGWVGGKKEIGFRIIISVFDIAASNPYN